MQTSTPNAPQEENTTDLEGHFKNQVQRFSNAYDEQNKGISKTVEYIQQTIENLRIQKSAPDAPNRQFISQSIAFNEAQLPPLRAKVQQIERVKDQLIAETTPIFENAIQNLTKQEEEESKEGTPKV